MGIFDNIFGGGGLGVTEKITSFISPVTSIKLPSLPTTRGIVKSIVRGGEESKAASTAAQSQAAREMKGSIRTPTPQRTSKETILIPTAKTLAPTASAVDIVRATNISSGAVTTETRAGGVALIGGTVPPNVFKAIFGGEQPDLSGGLTFEAPSVPVGDAPSVFEQIATGAMTSSEAQKILDERSLNTPNPLSGLSGLFDISNTTKLALFGLAAIAVFGITRK